MAETGYDTKRKSTLDKIDQAISALSKAGLRVTRQAIADECNLSIKTLDQMYIREHLIEAGVLKSKAQPSLEQQLATLDEDFKQVTAQNIKLHKNLAECKRALKEVNEKYKELSHRYERLLGAYQQKFEEDYDRRIPKI